MLFESWKYMSIKICVAEIKYVSSMVDSTFGTGYDLVLNITTQFFIHYTFLRLENHCPYYTDIDVYYMYKYVML